MKVCLIENLIEKEEEVKLEDGNEFWSNLDLAFLII